MARETRLWIVLTINVVLIGGLVAVGVTTHSLGVLSAGCDYLADAAAIGISLLAIRLSRRPPTSRRPNGYPKATAAAAFLNGGLLLCVVLFVSVAAIRRLAAGAPHVEGTPVLVMSVIAGAGMFLGAFILRGDVDADEDSEGDVANVRAILLDTLADAAAAAGVATGGLIIALSGGLYWLDPLVALIIGVVVGYHAIALLRRVVPALRGPARGI